MSMDLQPLDTKDRTSRHWPQASHHNEKGQSENQSHPGSHLLNHRQRDWLNISRDLALLANQRPKHSDLDPPETRLQLKRRTGGLLAKKLGSQFEELRWDPCLVKTEEWRPL